MSFNIFITGGTGFFGKNILRLLSSDVKITVLSRSPEKFQKEFSDLLKGKQISFIKGDIRDFALPKGVMYDYVIHGATEASAKLEKENPQEMYSVIVDGTRNLIHNVKDKTNKLLLISSGGVYGKQPYGLSHISETYFPAPITSYGKGKLESEKLCFDSGIPSVISRCFTFVGPYLPLDAHFAIGNFISNALKDEPIIINGDGSPYRSYMYADDLIEWLWAILLRGKVGEIYNVGSDIQISIADLAYLISSCFANKPEVKILGMQTAQNLKIITQKLFAESYVPSIDKVKKELNLQIKTGILESILKTISWYKS